MSNVLKFVYLAALAISFAAVAAFAQQYNAGNDTYNFYFQKAPGPQTVVQGGQAQQPQPTTVIKDGEVVQSAPSPVAQPQPIQQAAAQNAAPVQTVAEQANANRTWNLYGGIGSVYHETGSAGGGYSAKGYSIGLGYNVSKYFGLDATAIWADKASHTQATNSSFQRNNAWDGSLGVVVTPVHIQLFGYDFIQLSALGGLKSFTKSVGSSGGDSLTEVKSAVAYLGPRITVNINPNFGVILENKWAVGDTVSTQATLALNVKL